MAGDPAAGGGGNADPASGSKSSRSSSRHRQFRDRAKVRVDDLQEMFCGLQSARKESRSADAAVLEEQVHQMLREWRAELSVPSPASSLQMYYIDHELSVDDFLCDDDYKINISGSNEDQFNNLHVIGQLEHQQFDMPSNLPPTHSYDDGNNSEQNTGDVFVHMSDLLTTIWPSPSQYLGPKCALWDCGRPVGGTEDSGDYCNPYHAGLALNDDGLLGTRPVMRPKGIDLKDGPLFAALIAKVQGKNVGIPVCGGAATSKSPWNAPELFDLSLLEGESLREWLFFDTPRRAFESGNRKQRSLPDYSGRGWHESRKQIMKDFAGLKRSYYMDPQPSSSHEWHLFEYEINASDALALYRLEYKSSDSKKSAKSKLSSSPLNEIQQQMGRLTADSPVENKRTARSKAKANQKDTSANIHPHVNTPSQVNAPNAYQTTQQVNQMTFLNGNVVYGPHLPQPENFVYGPHLPHSENVVYGPHLPHGYSAEGSSFFWNPSDGT